MSGRSRVRRVEVLPRRRLEPDVVRAVRVLVGLAVEVERVEALRDAGDVKAPGAGESERGTDRARRAA